MKPENDATKARLLRSLDDLPAEAFQHGDAGEALRDVYRVVRRLAEDVERLKSAATRRDAGESPTVANAAEENPTEAVVNPRAETASGPEGHPASKVGRPKTFDSEHALGVALHGYWTQGPHAMSLNEVCRRARVSKPSLYREFGGEDGLLAAVLNLYQKTVVEVLREHMRADRTFQAAMKDIVDILLVPEGRPSGCLLAKFRLAFPDLGELTQQTVVRLVEENRRGIREWLERARRAGEIRETIALDDAAHLVDRQLMMAAVVAERGEDPGLIRRQLQMSLRYLAPGLQLQ